MTQGASSSPQSKKKNLQIPFLDTLIVRKPDGYVKLLVYRKTTHIQTSTYISAHTTHCSISAVWLRNRNIVTEEEDREQEEHHIHTALTRCGYLDWIIKKVKRQMETVKRKKVNRKAATQLPEVNKTTVVIPYVHGLSEAITRAHRRHGISSAMKPFQTIRSLLVHPKDKRRQQDSCECVYKIPCKNCDKTNIGETGRAFGVSYVFRNTDRKSQNVM